MSTIKFKKTNENATIPTRGTEYSAGYDLYACIEDGLWIEPHTTTKIDTGIAMEIPEGYFGGVFARSGISIKKGLRPSNCTGILDSDFRGSVTVALHNDNEHSVYVEPNERIAQLIVIPYLNFDWEETEELSETVRGDGGFGSTGE